MVDIHSLEPIKTDDSDIDEIENIKNNSRISAEF